MLKLFLFLLVSIFSDIAVAVPLQTWPNWVTTAPYVSKQVPPAALVARCAGLDTLCVLEVDQTTGELPVALSGASISIDYSGATGSAVPADAAFIGGTDGTNLRGVKTDSSGELQVDVLSSALPTGAATESTLQLAQATLSNIDGSTTSMDGTLTSIDNTLAGTLTTTSTNFPASVSTDAGAQDASTIRVTQGGRSYADSAYNNYTTGNVTTAAWTQLIASTANAINLLCITDQSGQIMELGTGAGGAESRVFLIAPGFSGCIPLRINSGTRIAVKAVTATASSGYITLSGMK